MEDATRLAGAENARRTGLDAQIIQGLRSRSQEALRELLREHGPSVRGALRRLFRVANPVIDDAMQEAAIRIWSNPWTFDPMRGDLREYFLVIAANRCRALRREHEMERSLDTGLLDEVPSPPEAPPVRQGRAADFFTALMVGIASLNERQQVIIRSDLRAGHSVPAKELAQDLGITPGTVYLYRHRACDRLREHLGAAGYTLAGERLADA